METAQLRDEIQTHAALLSADKLKVALDFLTYLVSKEEIEDDATRELLNIPNFEKELAEAEAQADSGELVSWRSIRKDVL
ncbi:MAG: hypothetical protein AAF171_18335 [Cyanobacteria bacterium P01_A01_bin.116]